MCGICGHVYAERSRSANQQILERMNRVILHRGPDSDGFHVKGNVGLGMRRLAIVDLMTGNQPLSNEDQTVWTVFNGEIYNYLELRRQLVEKGHHLATSSDTEVIVHLYEDYGVDCVDHLRGMFAFAIWDEKDEKLLIARDRMGKKPLYYAEHDGCLIFGSELKCILQYPGFPREIDWEAIHHYLTLQYVPDPWTAFRGIRKLPPAHTMTWSGGRTTIRPYWDLSYEPKWGLSEADLRQKVAETVADAVRVRLMSDVPLGVHLSGGIDSSIVVGLVAGMIGQPVKTFSIGFKESAFSELPYARLVAEKFQTDHHEFIVEPDACGVLPALVRHFDEPFADPAAIPTWYLAQMTRQHVTVALNGDGGDEAFAGYQRYYADVIADAYRTVPRFIRHGLINPLLYKLPVTTDRPMESNYLTAIRQLARAAEIPHDASVVRWGAYFDETEKRDLYCADLKSFLTYTESAQLLQETFRRAKASNRVDRTLYTDVHHYLPGALLPKVDRTTMAHSLEARSPFLDQRVMELAARLPRRWKVYGCDTKVILRKVFAGLVPQEIMARGKMGFGVPLTQWCNSKLYPVVADLLLSPDSRISRYFRQERIKQLVENNREAREDNGRRIWALLNLESWLREYVTPRG